MTKMNSKFLAISLFLVLNLTLASSAWADCLLCDNYTLRKAGMASDCDNAPACPELSTDGNNACTGGEDFIGMICGVTTESKEEKAVYNFNNALIPQQVIDDNNNKNQENGLQKAIRGLIGQIRVLFYDRAIKDPTKLYLQSNNISQSQIPEQVRPAPPQNTNPLQWFLNVVFNESGWLGRNGSTEIGPLKIIDPGNDFGVYRTVLPPFSDNNCTNGNNEVKDCEKLYNKAYYPAGISVIIPQQNL